MDYIRNQKKSIKIKANKVIGIDINGEIKNIQEFSLEEYLKISIEEGVTVITIADLENIFIYSGEITSRG